MGGKKKRGKQALEALESRVAPILELSYSDPLFSLAAHPTRPILLSGLATGEVQCHSYDAGKLEEFQRLERERICRLERETSRGKESSVVRSVSQLNHKWWTVVDDSAAIADDLDGIAVNWKTKRHKGSCRSVLFDPLPSSLGENVFTVGTDHVIKKAKTETGKVLSKTSIRETMEGTKDAVTKMIHSSTHPFLLLGTEEGDLIVKDSNNLAAPQAKFHLKKVNDDSINQILPMPAVSAYHYLTLGSTTLSHVDIRKGVLTQSDDQEDELLSMCFSSDSIDDNKNDTVLVSHGEGIVTIWKNSKNRLMDQLSRIKINPHASIDAIVPTMNNDDDDLANSVWCGDSEGLIYRINHKRGKVMETRLHSKSTGKHGAVDEVGMLDIDCEYRLISAGMESLKIWSGEQNNVDEPDSGSEDELSTDSDISDDDSSIDFSENGESEEVSTSEEESKEPPPHNGSSNDNPNVSLTESDQDESESELESAPTPQLQKKKRFGNDPDTDTIKDTSADTITDTVQDTTSLKSSINQLEPKKKKQKTKEKQLSTKQMKNLQKHEHGIRRFNDL